jgi:hypothetical protein
MMLVPMIVCQDRVYDDFFCNIYTQVTFFGGGTQTFYVESKGLPISITRSGLIELLKTPLPRTVLQESNITKLHASMDCVRSIMQSRQASPADTEAMHELLRELPTSVDDVRYTTPIADSTLHQLYARFGGEIK